ncbi:hypothetical protein GQ44DRAFT_561747, partial [Phaeosphaeriaceae sp. PMI808]
MENKVVFGRKEIKLLYSTYGEHDIYNSGSFKAMTRNLTTGAVLGRGHHCERCKGKMAASCYEVFHFGFCSEWVACKGKRQRCGERFALYSDGCSKHPRCQGYNKALYRAANGEEIQMSEFNDPDPTNFDRECVTQDQHDDMETEMGILDEVAEVQLELYGHIPANFHEDYFAQRA